LIIPTFPHMRLPMPIIYIQGLDYRTPDEVYWDTLPKEEAAA